jgi:hypothetical protein
MSNAPPKVTIHSNEETPAQAISAPAKRKPGTITDALGRKIVVKSLDPLQVYRLAKIMGAAADSDFARGYAALAACVREFEGEEEDFPTSDREIEAMMQRLGTEGLDAVNEALAELNVLKAKAAKEKSGRDTAKN